MTQTVALIDYGAGNVRSMGNALVAAARRADLRVTVELTADPALVRRADRIVLPGVGAFAACANGVAAVDGLYEAMEYVAFADKKPFLGVCVGMQLLADRGLEHGEHAGFGWIAGEVARLAPPDRRLKIPHMGWNAVARPPEPIEAFAPELERRGCYDATLAEGVLPPDLQPDVAARHPVFAGVQDGEHFYFVHSYAFAVEFAHEEALRCDYGGPFTAAVAAGNILGVQFHPEKSQDAGLNVLAAFLAWEG